MSCNTFLDFCIGIHGFDFFCACITFNYIFFPGIMFYFVSSKHFMYIFIVLIMRYRDLSIGLQFMDIVILGMSCTYVL